MDHKCYCFLSLLFVQSSFGEVDIVSYKDDFNKLKGAPLLHPISSEIVVQRGQQLELRCSSPDEIAWYFSKSFNNAVELRTHNHFLEETYLSSVIISNVEEKHVGRYFCSKLNAMDLFGDYKDHMQDYEAQFNASSIYVWLSDPNTPIVPQENTNIEAVDGVKFVAQCRPTSKSVQLELVLAADNKTSIGRMERSAGMVVDFDSLDNGASYICRDKERPNFYTTLSTHYVARPFYLYRPNIASECGNIVPEGSTVVLNCTVAFCDGRKPNMEWYFNGEPLVQSEKLLLSERLETSNDEDYCLNEMSETLTIQNAEKSDAGSYMCKTVEGWSSNFANYKLYVMETGGDFVYFNPVDNQPVVNVSRSAGRPARIILNYDSYPNLHSVEWYKDDKPICVSCKKGHRYEVIVTPTELQLIIKNPTVYDAARYTAVAKVGSIKEQYDVMLFVFDKPTLKMNSIYAVVGEHLNFSCQSRAYPEPVMDLYFIPCSSQEWSDCMAYEESERVASKISFQNTVELHTTIDLEVHMSGKVVCEASNSEGKATVESYLFAYPPYFSSGRT